MPILNQDLIRALRPFSNYAQQMKDRWTQTDGCVRYGVKADGARQITYGDFRRAHAVMENVTLPVWYVLVKESAVFTKEGLFFEASGGTTQDWGKAWEKIGAFDLDDARQQAIRMRRERWPGCHVTLDEANPDQIVPVMDGPITKTLIVCHEEPNHMKHCQIAFGLEGFDYVKPFAMLGGKQYSAAIIFIPWHYVFDKEEIERRERWVNEQVQTKLPPGVKPTFI